MAFQPVPDTARFSLIHDDSANHQAINVLYFRNPAVWGLPDLITACNTLAAAWVSQVLPLMSSGARLLRVESRGERAEVDVSYQLPLLPPPTGGAGGQILPYQCAFCVTHLSGFTGRSARGRTYFAFLTEDQQASGLISGTLASQFVGALDFIRSQMESAGWTHVIVSRYSGGVKRATAQTLDVIGYRARDTELDTQRRRTRANAP